MSDHDDELAELIGNPWPEEPPSPFDTLGALLDAPGDVRNWGLRKLIEADPVGAWNAMLPEYSATERLRFGEEYRRQQRARRARQMLDELQTRETSSDRPDLTSLTAFLAEPDDEVRFRIDGLWPRDGRIVLAAQNKSGKTTLTGNVIRCLADGDLFLDHFTVEQADRIVLIDNEMSPSLMRRWLREQGIRKTDAVDVVSLRGKLSSFNVLDPRTRAEWAQAIGEADVLIFDCLRPALDALGLSEDKESGRFLEAMDELLIEAQVGELLMVHHMGHTSERSRGDSRLEDWPDAKWKLVKDQPRDAPDDPRAPRFFSAFGRDVDQAEVRLAYDPFDRHLSVDGGSRAQSRAETVEQSVLDFVALNPGCTKTAIKNGVSGDHTAKAAAVEHLIAGGRLVRQLAGAQKQLHYLPGQEPQPG